MRAKRVVVVADLHCGHRVGLTPPSWQLHPVHGAGKHDKWVRLERALWKEFISIVRKLHPVDVLIVNGDAIDGRGKKSGSTELITSNRDEQGEMAIECLEKFHAKHTVMTYGTVYHTSEEGEDFENQVREGLLKDPATVSVKIGSHEWVDVNGCVFDVKHKISRSTIPHGRGTALLREIMWNKQWALRGEQPLADILIRSHVHYFTQASTDDCMGIITPALQGMGSNYGSRECSGTVDWGLVWFDVKSKADYEFGKHIIRIPQQKARVLKL